MVYELSTLVKISKTIKSIKDFVEGSLLQEILIEIGDAELRAASKVLNELSMAGNKKMAANRALTHLESAYEIYTATKNRMLSKHVLNHTIKGSFKSMFTMIDICEISHKACYTSCLMAIIHRYLSDDKELIQKKIDQALTVLTIKLPADEIMKELGGSERKLGMKMIIFALKGVNPLYLGAKLTSVMLVKILPEYKRKLRYYKSFCGFESKDSLLEQYVHDIERNLTKKRLTSATIKQSK